MRAMNYLLYFIGFAGGVASIFSYILQLKKDRSNVGHFFYVVFVFLFIIAVIHTASINNKYEKRIEQLLSVEHQANNILEHTKCGTEGEQRGFILTGLVFLEQFKEVIPDSYALAKESAISSGVLKYRKESATERLYEGWSLGDCSQAIESLIKGLSAGAIREEIN